MPTVQALLRDARTLPGESPVRDVEILLAHCLEKSRTWLYTWPDVELDPGRLAHFQQLLQRRRDGEPVAYLVGHREFWSLELEVAPSTLIPRPETEALVEWALELAMPDGARVMDLGTGSGAIALALASERPGWRVSGVDLSEAAVALATTNACKHGLERVQFTQSNWLCDVASEPFHLLVSNPPYIEENDAHLQTGDVRFEPRSALVSGADGLDDIAHITGQAPEHLCPGGWLLLEHGFEQGPAVRALLAQVGFGSVSTRNDLAGRERVTGGQWCAD